MERHIFTNTFIENFRKQTILSVTTFSSLYDTIISDSYHIQQEIKQQFLSIDSEKKGHYLNYVKNRFIVEILNEINNPTINKWVEPFNLNITDFPFFENAEVKNLLDVWIDQPYLDLEIQTKAIEIQKDFYLYAIYLEVTKIISLIDQLLTVSNDNQKTSDKTSSSTFKLIGNSQRAIKDKSIDLYDSLLKNGYLVDNCKKDFIKIFTGQQPERKIEWQGLKGELKLFINLLIEGNKIEGCKSSKWIIAAANFKFKNQEFTSNTIKDTKIAPNEIKLKNLVTRI